MDETDGTIRCACMLYACRVCRTKTGWRHQRWCELAGLTVPGCGECRYHDERRDACAHPSRRKGGAA